MSCSRPYRSVEKVKVLQQEFDKSALDVPVAVTHKQSRQLAAPGPALVPHLLQEPGLRSDAVARVRRLEVSAACLAPGQTAPDVGDVLPNVRCNRGRVAWYVVVAW